MTCQRPYSEPNSSVLFWIFSIDYVQCRLQGEEQLFTETTFVAPPPLTLPLPPKPPFFLGIHDIAAMNRITMGGSSHVPNV